MVPKHILSAYCIVSKLASLLLIATHNDDPFEILLKQQMFVVSPTFARKKEKLCPVA